MSLPPQHCPQRALIRGMAQPLARGVWAQGIRVMAFCPSPVDTGLWNRETAQMDFDRSQMLRVDPVADSLLLLALPPPGAVDARGWGAVIG